MNNVKRKIAVLLITMAISFTGMGSMTAADERDGKRSAAAAPARSVQALPADAGAADEPIYRVLGVVLFVWIGIALYLFRLDRKITRLEKSIK